MASLSLSTESISTLNSDDDFSDQPTPRTDTSARGSFLSVASDDSSGVPHGSGDFHHDAALSIFDSLVKNDDTSNMQLELTALRMSANASEHQVRRAVISAFMKRISQLVESGQSAKDAVTDTLPQHEGLIKRTLFEKEDQVDFLLLLQADLAHRRDGESILLAVAMKLYELDDVLEQDAFEQWWEDARSTENAEMERVRGKMGQFMDWLAESDEEDEDSEDDDDEEEEE